MPNPIGKDPGVAWSRDLTVHLHLTEHAAHRLYLILERAGKTDVDSSGTRRKVMQAIEQGLNRTPLEAPDL